MNGMSLISIVSRHNLFAYWKGGEWIFSLALGRGSLGRTGMHLLASMPATTF